MISFDKAQLVLQGQEFTLGMESWPLLRANGRILAKAIKAPMALPSFRNSAMDGFALNSKWINTQKHHEFLVEKIIKAGEVLSTDYKSQDVCAVMTGAYVPQCYDTVVPIEQVDRITIGKSKKIKIHKPIEPNQHIRQIGEDVSLGEQVLEEGRCLGAKEQALLMSLGMEEVMVFKKLKVALLTTGNEVLDVCQNKLPLGLLYNSNAIYLKQKLLDHGACVDYLGIIPDSPQILKKELLKIMEYGYDCVITTGAVSAGEYDFVPAVLKAMQAEILFHKVKMRPGKPILLGRLPSRQLIFSLPGNPVSAVVGLEFFVLPWLRKITHRKPIKPIFTQLVAATTGKDDFTFFKKARLQVNPSGIMSEILTGKMSFQIKPLLIANAWVKLPGSQEHYAKGSLVETYYQQ